MNDFKIIAGPCAIESEKQYIDICSFLYNNGVRMFRCGMFKPRTSMHSFQGVGGNLGYDIANRFIDTCDENITFVSEIVRPTFYFYEWIKEKVILQIGARNMYNYELLKKIAIKWDGDVLLKRSFSATIDEWIKAAEYLRSWDNKGVREVILCERGIRTFETRTRNTLDLSAVSIIKNETNFKVFVDPSHAAGRSDIIKDLCCASKAVGADGIMIEVHNDRRRALCDGNQALTFEQFVEIKEALYD